MPADDEFIHIKCTGSLSLGQEELLKGINAVVGQANSVLGGETMINILILISPLAIRSLAQVAIELLRNRRRIQIKVPGFEIRDIDSGTAKEVVAEILLHIESKSCSGDVKARRRRPAKP